jgi:hypothetical protein
MPVNLLDIQGKLRDFSAQSKARHDKLSTRQSEAADLLSGYANRLDELKNRVSWAADLNPQLRCAVPTDEALDAVIPAPALPETFTLIAADGSQINPSRHARIAFGVINIGLVRMVRGSGEAPQIQTQSHLLDVDALYTSGGRLISEGAVALKRDLLERQSLVDFSADLVQPAISMTDGPLELYREPQESEGFNKSLDQYIEVLEHLKDQNLMTLGYVDKPGSDLVGRLLELVQLSDADLEAANRRRRLSGITDSQLFVNLLQNPGDRSAVFSIFSQIGLRFRGDLGLHFFYLNVGLPGKPHLARIEVPAWVAKDKAKLGFVQAALLEQARIMGARPYPYILHRAHEIAIVNMAEHEHVEEMIVAEFERRGIPVDEKSNKQYHKDLPTGKTRYEG